MRIYNKLIICLGIAFGLVDALLAFLGQEDISVYFIANAMVFIIVVLAFRDLNPKSRSALNSMGAIIFIGFLASTFVKIVELLK